MHPILYWIWGYLRTILLFGPCKVLFWFSCFYSFYGFCGLSLVWSLLLFRLFALVALVALFSPKHHSFIHLFIRSFIPWFLHTCMHACMNPSMHPCIHTIMHSRIHSFTHSRIHSFVRWFVHSFLHSFFRSFIHSFGHSFIASFQTCKVHPSLNSKETQENNEKPRNLKYDKVWCMNYELSICLGLSGGQFQNQEQGNQKGLQNIQRNPWRKTTTSKFQATNANKQNRKKRHDDKPREKQQNPKRNPKLSLTPVECSVESVPFPWLPGSQWNSVGALLSLFSGSGSGWFLCSGQCSPTLESYCFAFLCRWKER